MMLVLARKRDILFASFSAAQTCSTTAAARPSMSCLVKPRPTDMTVPRSVGQSRHGRHGIPMPVRLRERTLRLSGGVVGPAYGVEDLAPAALRPAVVDVGGVVDGLRPLRRRVLHDDRGKFDRPRPKSIRDDGRPGV